MDKAQSFAMQYGYYDKEKKKACCVGYNAGYKQAEKDTIERAVRWIAENTKRYVGPIEHPFWDMFLKHFRKYMEEE